MPVGLTFDEYVQLRLTPPSRADGAFHEAVTMHVAEMFPMTTVQAASHLRSRGYDCRAPMLDLLIEDEVVTHAKPDTWSKEDVDRAAEYFENAGVFVPYGMMCHALGCSYAEFLRPLREAAEEASKKYGRHVRDDDQLFVMHRVPPRGITDKDGNLVDIKPSIISFTLCDDIREKLERGEEV